MASVTYIGGVTLALGTSFMNACGLSLQKLAHKRRAASLAAETVASEATKQQSYFREPLWLCGLLCMVIGSVASLGVFALLGQSRSACFASVTIVWNAILSRLVLKEQLHSVDALVTSLILAGSIISVIFGSAGAAQQAQNTLDMVIMELDSDSAERAGIVVFFLFLSCGLVISLRSAHIQAVERRKAEEEERSVPPALLNADAPCPVAADVGCDSVAEAPLTALEGVPSSSLPSLRASVVPHPGHTAHVWGRVTAWLAQYIRVPRMVECAARAMTAGLFSGTTGLCSKLVVVGIVAAVASGDVKDVLVRWQWYLALLGLPTSLVMQVHMLNSALRRFSTLEAVPLYQTSVSLTGLAFGWSFFGEAAGVSPVAMSFFLIGCCISCVGVCLLLVKAHIIHAMEASYATLCAAPPATQGVTPDRLAKAAPEGYTACKSSPTGSDTAPLSPSGHGGHTEQNAQGKSQAVSATTTSAFRRHSAGTAGEASSTAVSPASLSLSVAVCADSPAVPSVRTGRAHDAASSNNAAQPLGGALSTPAHPRNVRETRAATLHPAAPYVCESFYISDSMRQLAEHAVAGLRERAATFSLGKEKDKRAGEEGTSAPGDASATSQPTSVASALSPGPARSRSASLSRFVHTVIHAAMLGKTARARAKERANTVDHAGSGGEGARRVYDAVMTLRAEQEEQAQAQGPQGVPGNQDSGGNDVAGSIEAIVPPPGSIAVDVTSVEKPSSDGTVVVPHGSHQGSTQEAYGHACSAGVRGAPDAAAAAAGYATDTVALEISEGHLGSENGGVQAGGMYPLVRVPSTESVVGGGGDDRPLLPVDAVKPVVPPSPGRPVVPRLPLDSLPPPVPVPLPYVKKAKVVYGRVQNKAAAAVKTETVQQALLAASGASLSASGSSSSRSSGDALVPLPAASSSVVPPPAPPAASHSAAAPSSSSRSSGEHSRRSSLDAFEHVSLDDLVQRVAEPRHVLRLSRPTLGSFGARTAAGSTAGSSAARHAHHASPGIAIAAGAPPTASVTVAVGESAATKQSVAGVGSAHVKRLQPSSAQQQP